MRKILLVGALALSALSLQLKAQDCNAVVSDDAHLFTSIPAIEQAASKLSSLDADVHVISTDNPGATLDAKVAQIQQTCPSWQQGSRKAIKNNLVVFIVSRHRVGLYYGNEFKKILDPAVGMIKQDHMIPDLKRGDFNAGIINGINQTAIQVQAFNESVLHPTQKQTVINNQATDFHGFWVFLGWLLALVVIGVLVFYLIKYIRFKQAIKEAQRCAVEAKSGAASLLLQVKNWLVEQAALGVNVISHQNAFDIISEQFSELNGNLSMDPSSDDFSIDTYNSLTKTYNGISNNLRTIALQDAASTILKNHHSKYKTRAHSSHSNPVAQTTSEPEVVDTLPKYPTNNYPAYPGYTHQQPSYVDNSTSIIAPVIIEEDHDSYRDRANDYQRQPTYSEPAPTRDDSNDSDNSRDFGGSDSSFDDNTSSDTSSDYSSDNSSDSGSDFGGSDSSF
jgi:uncharacterized membrane protein YgcG